MIRQLVEQLIENFFVCTWRCSGTAFVGFAFLFARELINLFDGKQKASSAALCGLSSQRICLATDQISKAKLNRLKGNKFIGSR
jgi:hypothetical protein